MAITQAQMRMLQRRRTTDIDRLAQQYKRNVEALTGEYQASFGQYQQRVAEQMKPFEEQLEKYKVDMSAYEQQATAYKDRLSQYSKALEDYKANPTEKFNLGSAQFNFKSGTYEFNIPNVGMVIGPRLEDYGYRIDPEYEKSVANIIRKGGALQNVIALKDKPAPAEFKESAPTAPTAPSAPQAAQFDTSQFDQKRAALETDFRREVGERKASRMSAVSRRAARPLMQGGGS